MTFEIYPKFNKRTINGILYTENNIIEAFHEFDYKSNKYVDFYSSDSYEISIKNIIGKITDIYLDERKQCFMGEIDFLNTDMYQTIKNVGLNQFALVAIKIGNVNEDNIGNIHAIKKLSFIYKKDLISIQDIRKEKINKLFQ